MFVLNNMSMIALTLRTSKGLNPFLGRETIYGKSLEEGSLFLRIKYGIKKYLP